MKKPPRQPNPISREGSNSFVGSLRIVIVVRVIQKVARLVVVLLLVVFIYLALKETLLRRLLFAFEWAS